MSLLWPLSGHTQTKEFWKGPFFWQQKESIHQRMTEQRYIPVSILRQGESWSIKGAGIVKASADFVFEYAKDFDHLKKYTDVFQKVDWDPKTMDLVVSPKFFATSLEAKLHVWTEQTAGSESEHLQKRVHFKILQGPLKGAEGALLISEVSRQECEVGLISVYSGQVLAFANDLVSVAMESVLHRLAQALREAVEAAWTQNQSAPKKTL